MMKEQYLFYGELSREQKQSLKEIIAIFSTFIT